MTITRFAPSPTGYLHVGGARTALFSWLAARHDGGKFLLRIEDTDLARSTEQAAEQLLEDLRWLGLHWDNPRLVYQSQRLDTYNRIFDDLIARGLAYQAYETPEEMAELRKAAELQKKSFIYRRRDLAPQQLAQYQAENRPHVVRLAIPVREYRFRDVVLDKEIVFAPEEVQDFVIRKADGMPTYHFAVVVDDAEMGITHILRGQEHTKNTFYHIALQEALGYPRPVYGHLPIILNLDGSKMGKRDRDRKIRQRCFEYLKSMKTDGSALTTGAGLKAERISGWLDDSKQQLDIPEQEAVMAAIGMNAAELPEIMVHDFRRSGYLPEVLLNFLALLGWNPGGDRERMSVDELISLFSIDRVGKSNSKFSREKLLAFNTEACEAASPQRLLAAFRDCLSVNPQSPLNQADDAALLKLLQMKKGFRTLREVDEPTRFFFIPDEQVAYDSDALEKVLRKQGGQGAAALKEVRSVLENQTDWTAPSLEAAVKGYCEQKQLSLGKVAQPIRVAISGTTVSPPIFESLEFLGKSRTMARIDRCLVTQQG